MLVFDSWTQNMQGRTQFVTKKSCTICQWKQSREMSAPRINNCHIWGNTRIHGGIWQSSFSLENSTAIFQQDGISGRKTESCRSSLFLIQSRRQVLTCLYQCQTTEGRETMLKMSTNFMADSSIQKSRKQQMEQLYGIQLENFSTSEPSFCWGRRVLSQIL